MAAGQCAGQGGVAQSPKLVVLSGDNLTMTKRSKFIGGGLLLLVLLVAAGATAWLHGRDTLWRIVSENCVPAAQQGKPSRCTEASIGKGVAAGDVVFKDKNGPLQYLVMPTARVAGIEDPQLLRPEAPPYFADAWRARHWMETTHGAPIPAEDAAIALNSAWSRSQDQLHLHVSCVRADLKARLKAVSIAPSDTWAPLPGGWNGHAYLVRSVAADTLDGIDPIRDVAAHVPGAAGEMGHQAIAVVGAALADGRRGFWLLESSIAPMSGWLGGIEGDVQDHSCVVLR
jgi:CDP-diacylglycerol pyrophosphatase